MTSNEIFEEYSRVLYERFMLKNKIDDFIEKWKNGDTKCSTATIQETLDKGYERLEELSKKEENLYSEYIVQRQKEEATDKEIVCGVLSSDARKSHLIGQQKTPEQLEKEKMILLREIKNKVRNHDISLAEASKLTSDVNTAYSFYSNRDDKSNSNEMHIKLF